MHKDTMDCGLQPQKKQKKRRRERKGEGKRYEKLVRASAVASFGCVWK